jgi:hypothetical protein
MRSAIRVTDEAAAGLGTALVQNLLHPGKLLGDADMHRGPVPCRIIKRPCLIKATAQ